MNCKCAPRGYPGAKWSPQRSQGGETCVFKRGQKRASNSLDKGGSPDDYLPRGASKYPAARLQPSLANLTSTATSFQQTQQAYLLSANSASLTVAFSFRRPEFRAPGTGGRQEYGIGAPFWYPHPLTPQIPGAKKAKLSALIRWLAGRGARQEI